MPLGTTVRRGILTSGGGTGGGTGPLSARPGAPDDVGELRRGSSLRTRNDVGVDPHRNGRAAVTQIFAHGGHVLAGREHHGCRPVAQMVEARLYRQTGSLER